MLTHGILTSLGIWDNLIHEMEKINEFDSIKRNKKIDWKKIDKTYNWRVR